MESNVKRSSSQFAQDILRSGAVLAMIDALAANFDASLPGRKR
jgi:hypothetical protein